MTVATETLRPVQDLQSIEIFMPARSNEIFSHVIGQLLTFFLWTD